MLAFLSRILKMQPVHGKAMDGFKSFILLTILSVSISTLYGQQKTVVLKSTKDAYVDINLADEYFGNSTYILVNGEDAEKRGLVRFYTGGIPHGAIINSAKLTLHMAWEGNYSDIALSVKPITSPWYEKAVAWNNQPACDDSREVLLLTDASFVIDVTNIVQAWINRDILNHGFLLSYSSIGSADEIGFYSSEYYNGNYAPELEITYTIPPDVNPLIFYPDQDAEIGWKISDANRANTNYEAYSVFRSLCWTESGQQIKIRSLMKLDLSGIPDGAEVTQATLTMQGINHYLSNSGTSENSSHLTKIQSDWLIEDVTWNSIYNVSTSGNINIPATLIGNWTQDVEMNITSFVNDWLGGEPNYGMMMMLNNEGTYRCMYFGSSDHTDPAQHPKLEVTLQHPYDAPASAYQIENTNQWMSEDAEFTTVYATPDGGTTGCYDDPPVNNVWFTFTTPEEFSGEVEILLKKGGDLGTITGVNMGLYDAAYIDDVACMTEVGQQNQIRIYALNLQPSTQYVIGVDNMAGTPGTFTLGVNTSSFATVESSEVVKSVNETVTLQASGGVTYSWSPVTGLDDPASSNPQCSVAENTTYTVTVIDENGFTDTKEVNVTVVIGVKVTNTYYASQDAYVSSGYPDDTYGSERYLSIENFGYYANQSYIQFNLNSIPSQGVVIQSAELQLYSYTGTTVISPLIISKSQAGWNESNITWNNQPDLEDRYTYDPGSYPQSEITVDIKGLVEEWVNDPNSNYGLRIEASTSSQNKFGSREFGYSYGIPKIEITYYDVTERTRDSLALVAFYNSTNGNSWTTKTNWLTGPINTWYGVTVSNNRVTSITLRNNNLTGTLPAEIGDLTELVTLSIYTNAITGAIPPEIGNLTKLQNLHLYGNQFSGTIPAEIGDLESVKVLYLHSNQLTGSIPVEIGNLNQLTHLYLCYNQLSGSIPDTVYSLVNLQYLMLYNNAFTGAVSPELANLSNLVYLYLFNNQLEGEILPYIYSMTNLRYFQIYNNRFTGTISEDIRYLKQLRYFQIDRNQFTGTIPDSLFSLPLLERLYLNSNQFTGSISPCISNCTNMVYLYLNNNQFTGTILPYIYNLIKLQYLNLYTNQFTGELTDDIGNLTQLKVLSIGGNGFTGTIPMVVWNLNELTSLGLNSCQFTGTIPPEIGNLTNLIVLNLQYNQFSGTLPVEIGNLTKLTQVYLSYNQFSGNIPSQISNCTLMQYLYLNNNNFEGEILPYVTTMSNLLYLRLHYNNFSGEMPSGIGNLTKLIQLLIYKNSFSGELPDEICNLTNLTHFQLHYNNFEGDIPDCIGNLTHLYYFYIYKNNFSGPLPSSLTSCPLITTFVHYNQFTFSDLLPTINQISGNKTYAPQNAIGKTETREIVVNTDYTLNLGFDGDLTTSTYKWYKNGSLFATTTTNEISFTPITFDDAGVYTCIITNTDLSGLTLSTAAITLDVDYSAIYVDLSLLDPNVVISVSAPGESGIYQMGDRIKINPDPPASGSTSIISLDYLDNQGTLFYRMELEYNELSEITSVKGALPGGDLVTLSNDYYDLASSRELYLFDNRDKYEEISLREINFIYPELKDGLVLAPLANEYNEFRMNGIEPGQAATLIIRNSDLVEVFSTTEPDVEIWDGLIGGQVIPGLYEYELNYAGEEVTGQFFISDEE